MVAIKMGRVLCLWLLFAVAALPARDAAAQPREVRVAVSSAQVVTFSAPAQSVFIADPAIADIQVASPTSVIVFGRKPGQTTLIAMGADEKPLANIQIAVGHNHAELRRLILQEAAAPGIKVTPTPTGIVLSGIVPTNEAADKVVAAAQRFAPENVAVVNHLEVSGPAQVNLRVRVAEVSRNLTKQLGFNWDAVAAPGSFAFGVATGLRTVIPGLITRAPPLLSSLGSASTAAVGVSTNRLTINGVIDALAAEGLITILAQPNLTAISGQPASFLAGGEFPVPVASNNDTGGRTITVEFKEFGVKLGFVPTVLSSDRIAINVRPEVSQLSTEGAIETEGFTIPALTTRRAETTIQLGSGESFAIAGLIQSNMSTAINKTPWLGDLPIIGSLFRSSRFQRSETELVIIVTPYVVRPVAEGPALKTPTDGLEAASDFERILLDRLVKPSPGAAHAYGVGARLRGDAGFIFQ